MQNVEKDFHQVLRKLLMSLGVAFILTISSASAPASVTPEDIAAKIDAYMSAAQKLKWFSG